MTLEIELKARIPEETLPSLLESLEAEGHLEREVIKEDRYFGPESVSLQGVDFTNPRLFRLRRKNGTSLVTLKRKRIERGIEVSEEIEFTVGQADAFEAFARAIGYHLLITKRKDCRIYAIAEDLSAELNRVDGLGTFLELELLRPDDESDIPACKKRLKRLLARLGVDESAIEARPYTDLLRDRA